MGYKAHIAMDQGSELIRSAIMTSAKVADSSMGDNLICGDERAVYGDKGYESIERSARLARLGITDGIMRKLLRHSRDPHPVLTARNRQLAKIRGAVERKFAVMKERYRCRRVRYRGLVEESPAPAAGLLCDEPQARGLVAGRRCWPSALRERLRRGASGAARSGDISNTPSGSAALLPKWSAFLFPSPFRERVALPRRVRSGRLRRGASRPLRVSF